jgi:uncharacterized protein DUF5670
MLEVSAIVLLVAWLLGLLSTYTFGGAIHAFLLLAMVLFLLKLVGSGGPSKGRR